MIKNFSKLINLLTKTERYQALLLLALMSVVALIDMIGVASIMPFIAILTKPELTEGYYLLKFLEKTLNNGDIQDLKIVFGISVLSLFLIGLLLKSFVTYLQLRFTLMREHSIGRRLFEGYLHQPYSWYLNRNSADLGRVIFSEVGAVIYGGMMPFANMVSQFAVVLSLLIMLTLVNPILALTAFVVLGAAYGIIYKLTKGRLARSGKMRIQANQRRFAVVSEAFGATKEIKIGDLENTYIKRFSDPSKIYAKHQAVAQIAGLLPRYALEAVAFGGIMIFIIYSLAKRSDLVDALPIIALYVFAGYRLLPALQAIYGAASQLRFIGPALDVLHSDLMSLEPFNNSSVKEDVSFNSEIVLKNIEYSYPNADRPALKDLTLSIPVNAKIGFVGGTGGGKTTAIDLLLGLLVPQKGVIELDGQIISKRNYRSWQRMIGYVPQQIFLADDSVAGNIAFGINKDCIDWENIERAAKVARINDFIVNELPQGYQTNVGERGVRLSGGQRQRIGIARAIYKNPKILILDEATSSLDNITEQAVMESINSLNENITVIMIAHRLSTVRYCDQIYLMENGSIRAHGTYEELLMKDKLFMSMVKA